MYSNPPGKKNWYSHIKPRYKTLQDLKKKKQLTDKELDGLIQYFKERKENMAKKYGEEKITMEGQSYYYIASELLP